MKLSLQLTPVNVLLPVAEQELRRYHPTERNKYLLTMQANAKQAALRRSKSLGTPAFPCPRPT